MTSKSDQAAHERLDFDKPRDWWAKMGWKTFCCVRPNVVDRRETPHQNPASSSHKTGDSQLQAAQTPGGRTLLVTAQSGSAREFEGYLGPHRVHSRLSVPPQLPCEAQSKDTQADGAATCDEACSAAGEERSVARSDSRPAGDMQRPPGSLLEASLRRRSRAAKLSKRQHKLLKQEASLDDQQLTTIVRFMGVYKGQLDGAGFQLEEDMSPLLADDLVLRAHDGKVYNGKAAALRRLQHGTISLTIRPWQGCDWMRSISHLPRLAPYLEGFNLHMGCLHHLMHACMA